MVYALRLQAVALVRVPTPLEIVPEIFLDSLSRRDPVTADLLGSQLARTGQEPEMF